MDEKFWNVLRFKRNKFLAETDHTQLADYPTDTKTRVLYREYRQYLRDLPKMFDDKTIDKAKVKNFEQWKAWRKGGDY